MPERARTPAIRIGEPMWEALEIPASMAFFFRHSGLDRMVALYSGPGGATESLLPMEARGSVTAAHPELASLEPDVEALLVRRNEGHVIGVIVPIDRCYELIGRLRRTWSGWAGGDAAHAEMDALFARLAGECDGPAASAGIRAEPAAIRTPAAATHRRRACSN